MCRAGRGTLRVRGGESVAKGKYAQWLDKDKLTLLQGWARDGLVDEQIAHNMGISCATLYDWKNRFPEICEALKKGKEVVDIEVENALLKRALGYDYDEVITEDGRETRRVRKHMAPDVTALIYWLKNRRPEAWRERRGEEPTAADNERRTGVVVLPAVIEEGEGDE